MNKRQRKKHVKKHLKKDFCSLLRQRIDEDCQINGPVSFDTSGVSRLSSIMVDVLLDLIPAKAAQL